MLGLKITSRGQRRLSEIYASGAMTARAEYEAGGIDMHQAEQRLMDLGWCDTAIWTFMEWETADG